MVVPGELLCVTDSVSGVKFLADTGASYSCLPFRSTAAAPDVPSLKGDHEQAVRAVLESLREYGLVLNLEKCEFGRREIQFLGHKITVSGIEPLTSHVAAVSEFMPPQDKQGMQRFLGLVNFYRRFLPGAAGVLKPLTDALRGPGGKKRPLVWTEPMSQAFQAVKDSLCAAVGG
jgi:hypothetical protein